jgi:hypothetical protein
MNYLEYAKENRELRRARRLFAFYIILALFTGFVAGMVFIH